LFDCMQCNSCISEETDEELEEDEMTLGL
jgi:hypothetical protein